MTARRVAHRSRRARPGRRAQAATRDVVTLTERHAVGTRLHRRLPARVLRDGTVLYWWVEIIAILVFYFVYSQIRNANRQRPGGGVRATRRTIIRWQHRSASSTSRRSQSWALHFTPLIIASQLLLRVDALRRHDRRRGRSCSASGRDDYPTLAQHARHRDRHRADRVHAVPAHAAPAAPRRTTASSTRSTSTRRSGRSTRRDEQDLQPVRGHAERALRWALWCACALVPRLKRTWAKWLAAAVPGDHRHRDRAHREPLLPRRGRRFRDPRRRRSSPRAFTRAGRGPAVPSPVPTDTPETVTE